MPISTRYLPIRDAVCEALEGFGALADVKQIAKDEETFAALPATCYPALGVFYADNAGEETALWAATRRDHRYWLEVRIAVRSLESAQASEDLLFGYIEAVEDALRATPTLGGLVRNCSGGVVSRVRQRVGEYWHAEAAFLVTCESAVN